MSLFNWGEFTLHSGSSSNFKIDCDALTDDDWKSLAFMLSDHAGRYSKAVGIPNGGLKMAALLNRIAWADTDPILIVDDVLTTGASMEAMRVQLLNENVEREIKGAVVFARGPVPAWITALFVLTS